MRLEQARRIVIKVGSALLIERGGHIRADWLQSLLADIAALRAEKKQIIIVSSGAVALGKKYIHHNSHPLKLEEKQAAAACGQIELVNGYQHYGKAHGLHVAQMLLTIEDSEDRRRYLNARSTLETLLENGIIPIINENDTVATEELRFGDNDRLAARVAQMAGADVLVLLSDIDGLYTDNPHKNPKAEFIPLISSITPEIEAMASGSASAVGSGGMITKIAAAKIATRSGCHMVITEGKPNNPLQLLKEGGRASWFISDETPISARKHWIAHTLHPVGTVIIDDGAERALQQGKSLLPAGVVAVQGRFSRGDAIMVKNGTGQEIARGISAYFSEDALRIIGRKSSEIADILGYSGRTELIHRDDLVMFTI